MKHLDDQKHIPKPTLADEPTFTVDTDELTVYHVDSYGEKWDMNSGGISIESKNELVKFVNELHRQGLYDTDVRNQLIKQIF